MLHGQPDVALLWDIRVASNARGRGVGSALLAEVERWSMTRGARWLEVETQDINVPACRFYERHGFVLRSVNRDAYPGLPGEAQLLWYKELGMSATPSRSSESA
jgi:ribosomal protein S18 acetylase RimI-like enzyme